MLDKVIHFSIKNKIVIGLFTLALIAWGSYSVTQLPIDAVPDITNNQVQIITVSPSLAAEEIERLVTFPVEQKMATIPQIDEVRSFSRFGLSVVTIVFKDNVNVYWARQQVSERLANINNQLPLGVGTPELAPVTTGLGEIYQYVIHTKKGYEKKYSAMDLRTIQDWIVRRQLLGTDGIADVSSFGGYLKQYEIALNADKLRSMNISISDVFTAMQKNNQNTGAAYIDKKPNAYFIRSEGLIGSIEDIEKIVVKVNTNGIPILIRNVATVNFGNAIRYGAMTRNNEGEVVGAIVMMLKGENSSKVIANVKQRMKQIEKSLPEGVVIEPFLDRTKLVNNAIGTVTKNLAEGALIVIFVLVLLLGNLRAGLIVASVIPLAMLFAISLMNLFGVSGNLMSLGAIDFGLIVDGAVIIVEATLHHLTSKQLKNKILSQAEMDDEVYSSASKIRSSAAFGEIIILIVYLPILALVGVEGKMFSPMAQTVVFAILGAFLLSVTYVPMMSALFLNKKTEHRHTISDSIINFFQKLYTPLIHFSLKRKAVVLITAAVFFILSLVVFIELGGEFIPTLDEGDFAVETRVLAGSSISQTIDAALKSAKILKDKFPEVKEVIGKIGSSEIPTDPMPVEACDLIIVLKDKADWVSATSRDELAEKMAEELEAIPGVAFSFQQPIQMRFNELMTGAKQDVVIKVYGENLNTLNVYAEKIGQLASKVNGAIDIYVEQVTGQQQIVIKFNRDKIALFGLNIEDVNQVIKTAFAGQTAGIVYEGEKRFDLVVRLEKDNRKSIEDIKNLFVTTPTGAQVPIAQVADVYFKSSPNQIQRDDAKRRITIGFNVRGKDIETVVKEMQQKIDANIKFEAGYYPTYGGTFKNLVEARNRLSIAVPVALLLIFMLLFFTFNSFKQSFLIFTTIPLSAIGGVFALWIRGMPFSISAGVGFIALFGVAVLNGIVLIGYFNQLKKEGMEDIIQRVLIGTKVRLRPVIMTAAVASLGFLPLALSHGAGAEVQKPLATVVIGGLISATLLTLIVLPVLYVLFEKIKKSKNQQVVIISFLALTLIPNFLKAQRNTVLKDWIVLGLKNNYAILSSDNEINQAIYLKKTANEIGKTSVTLTYGQYNSFAKKDNNISILQTLPFPTTMLAKSNLYAAQIQSRMLKKKITEAETVYQIKLIYYEWLNLNQLNYLFFMRDSVYAILAKASALRYKTGESTLLEKTTAEARSAEIKNKLLQVESDRKILSEKLKAIINVNGTNFTDATEEEAVLNFTIDSSLAFKNPYVNLYKQQIEIADKQKRIEKLGVLPDITLGYFNQSLYGVPNGSDAFAPLANYGNRFQGFVAGVSFPLWYAPQSAKIKVAQQVKQNAELLYKQANNTAYAEIASVYQNYLKNKKSLIYYKTIALPNAELISKQSMLAFQKGNISYAEHSLNLQQAEEIKSNYLNTLFEYNKNSVTLEFLTGQAN